MSDQRFIELSETIAAPLNQVYAAFKNSVALQSWFSDFVEVAFKEKGRLYCWWNVGYFASGSFSKIVDNEHIAFTWSGPDEPHGTVVDIFFTPKVDVPKAFAPEVDMTKVNVTDVKIRHSGIGSGSEWNERLSAYKKGWEIALQNLKSVMETGIDKRVYDRPMLGIIPGDLIDEERALKLRLPVQSGITLSGIVDGMRAEAAGLQKDDIIISLNQHDLKGYQDLADSISKCKVGDDVEVTFYRDGGIHTVNMTLSRLQLPKVPHSASELGESLAEIYDEVASERDTLFIGVNDTVASTRPAPDSWSAKETLVHLLYTERWLHLAISCAISEQRTGGFANQIELISAMASVYTLEELLAELKRSEQITVASFKALPNNFVSDKRKFLGLVNNLGQGFAWHTRVHFDQIKAAIEAARPG